MEHDESHDEATVVSEAVEQAPATLLLEERLSDIVFKLRAHNSPEGEFGMGEESGCEMAAGMIENLLRQLGDTQGE